MEKYERVDCGSGESLQEKKMRVWARDTASFRHVLFVVVTRFFFVVLS